jgi:hypothetical protein
MEFWFKLMPTIGPLEPGKRTQAMAHVMEAVRGVDEVDDAKVGRLIEELRQRFNVPPN